MKISENVSLGLGQLFNPTPKAASRAFNVYLTFVSLLALASVSFTGFPPALALFIKEWGVFSVAGVRLLCKSFGIDEPQQPAA